MTQNEDQIEEKTSSIYCLLSLYFSTVSIIRITAIHVEVAAEIASKKIMSTKILKAIREWNAVLIGIEYLVIMIENDKLRGFHCVGCPKAKLTDSLEVIIDHLISTEHRMHYLVSKLASLVKRN